jgi:D-glycero-beta-D-manno-heptose-7-phosphate kinase
MSTDFDTLFHRIGQLKIAVIGDVMLDTYWWGHVERISPEAPVPVVSVDKKEYRIGGAGNVALNIASMGAIAYAITVMGKDDDGDQLKALLAEKGIDTTHVVQSTERITTNKIRIISRNQQMMRLDAETTKDITANEEDKLLYAFEDFIASESPDVVILEDYNKGVLTHRIINRVIELCQKHNIITAVDPKRKNFFTYKGVDIFKPNLKEVKEALNIIADGAGEALLKDIHLQLEDKLNHQISFITLSEKGVFYAQHPAGQQQEVAAMIAPHLRNIADVSGAGDTVIAVASLVYAASKDVALMAAVANIAGGLVCEEVGTAAIDREKLQRECRRLLGDG